MSYANIILSEEGLVRLLGAIDVYGFDIPDEDIKQLRDGLQYAEDKNTLEKNAVKTPLSYYK